MLSVRQASPHCAGGIAAKIMTALYSFTMSNKQSFNSETELGSGVTMKSQRKMELSSDGVWLLEDFMEITGEGAMTFVMCDAWLLEFFELEVGEFYFKRGEENVCLQTKRFGAFYPPFAIVRVCFKDARGCWNGMAGTTNLPTEFSSSPFIFETDVEAPKNFEQLKELLHSSRNRQSIEINPTPSLLSIRAKRLIDENYQIYPSIARIAARLKVTHEHLTRQFKRDFLMSPSEYLHQLRIADATYRLSKGEEIIEVSQDVGYNDLSRFYKQFRKAMTKTPRYCQIPKQKQKR
jgi:AraC-like DNA-binding protein